MNQRREPRLPVDQPVEVTVYGVPDIHLKATIRNASGRGIGLELEGPLATGSALKITLPDAILLGEVIYCRSQGGVWYAGIELDQSLCGLAELASSVRAFSEEFLGPQRQHTVKHAHDEDEK